MVKPVYKGHSRELEKVAFISRWPLYTGLNNKVKEQSGWKFTGLYKPKVNENEEGFDSVKGSSEGTGREQIEENVELLPTWEGETTDF